MIDVIYGDLTEHEIKAIERDLAETKSEEYLFFSQHLLYNKISGEVIRRNNSKNACQYKKDGRCSIVLNRREYSAGFVSWCLNTGYYPSKREAIVYLDGNKKNIRFDNLRLVTIAEQRVSKTIARKRFGVFKLYKSTKFHSRITFKSKTTYLGEFETEQLARIAYMQAKLKRIEQVAHAN